MVAAVHLRNASTFLAHLSVSVTLVMKAMASLVLSVQWVHIKIRLETNLARLALPMLSPAPRVLPPYCSANVRQDTRAMLHLAGHARPVRKGPTK